MIKGFLKIPIDGRGDMIISISDISHVFSSPSQNPNLVQTTIILKTLGAAAPLKVNCELKLFEERLAKAVG
jgi:hypothetical protein